MDITRVFRDLDENMLIFRQLRRENMPGDPAREQGYRDTESGALPMPNSPGWKYNIERRRCMCSDIESERLLCEMCTLIETYSFARQMSTEQIDWWARHKEIKHVQERLERQRKDKAVADLDLQIRNLNEQKRAINKDYPISVK